MRMLFLAGGGAVFSLVTSLMGQTINVGDHVLLPNRAGQTFTLSVSGGAQVQGENFNAQIAGGGTANGGTPGPIFTGVDLITGTIFSGNNTGQQNLTLGSQVYSGSVITSSSTVPATGLLTTLTIDTTGFLGGETYSLKLAGFSHNGVSGNTDFAVGTNGNPIPANVTNGNLIVVYPGDINEDGTVNAADFNILAQHYGLQTGGTWALGDFNGDGKVDFTDFTIMTQHWGASVNITPAPPAASPAEAGVPEPASFAVLGIAGIVLLQRRRG